ncbi:MAG TPA: hypothetical protein EYQ31_01385 [Candidatus Handelsmanbacteria bacterium]|nr:hypothetical protein [Candidatus Handelsmanbacteria bacterium]
MKYNGEARHTSRHHFTFHPMLLLAALVVLPAYSTAGHIRQDVAYDVYYLFDPADDMQLERATDAYRSMLSRDEVEWIGIRETSASPVSFAPLVLVDLLSAADQLSEPVLQWLHTVSLAEESQDQILVQNRLTRHVYAGTDMQRVAAASGLLAGIRTDVGVTTWGKVKELFR